MIPFGLPGRCSCWFSVRMRSLFLLTTAVNGLLYLYPDTSGTEAASKSVRNTSRSMAELGRRRVTGIPAAAGTVGR